MTDEYVPGVAVVTWDRGPRASGRIVTAISSRQLQPKTSLAIATNPTDKRLQAAASDRGITNDNTNHEDQNDDYCDATSSNMQPTTSHLSRTVQQTRTLSARQSKELSQPLPAGFLLLC